jgi:hypothetical protein
MTAAHLRPSKGPNSLEFFLRFGESLLHDAGPLILKRLELLQNELQIQLNS